MSEKANVRLYVTARRLTEIGNLFIHQIFKSTVLFQSELSGRDWTSDIKVSNGFTGKSEVQRKAF